MTSAKTRVLEWVSSTTEERKAVSRVVSAIRAATNMSFDDIYRAAHGSLVGQGIEDERNLGKGTIGHKKLAPIHRWIVDNHLPLASTIAPEVFDPSLLTRWSDFLHRHAIYDRLRHHLVAERGLTERSRQIPISDISVPLGSGYYFTLDTQIGGTVLALENHEGDYYPVALHTDGQSLLTDVTAGSSILPHTGDSLDTPDPLVETMHTGLRCYVLVVGAEDILRRCAKGMTAGHPVTPAQCDKIALAFADIADGQFEVHRLNIVFTQRTGQPPA